MSSSTSTSSASSLSSSKLLSLGLPLLLLVLQGASIVQASDVWELKKGNFHKKVDPEELMLVEFFAPWCGHCKALAPHYEEAATTLKENGSSIKLAKVDCVAEPDLCSDFGVQGYPTMKVFRKGEHTDYSGPRKADGIISYMKKQALPAISTLADAATHDAFTKADSVVMIAYLDSTPESAAFEKVFSEYANKHRDDYLFGSTTSSDVVSSANAPSAPSLVLYKSFDEGRNEYDIVSNGALTQDSLEDFIKTNSMPLLDQISPDNFGNYADSGLPLAYVFVDPEDEKTRQEVLKEVEGAAKAHKGKINFVWIDASKFSDHAKSLNLAPTPLPAFAIQSLSEGTKYPFDQKKKIVKTDIEAFVDAFAKGELKPSIKSQSIPASPRPEGSNVVNVVADSFDSTVFEGKGKDQDILFEFYAPWCGHCKKLAPTYEQLADKYASVQDKLVIAKMDATENDVPPSAGFRVSGFPTIKFKKTGSNEFTDYVGGRSLEDFVDFLHRESGNDITPKENVTGGGAEQVVFDKKDGKHEEL